MAIVMATIAPPFPGAAKRRAGNPESLTYWLSLMPARASTSFHFAKSDLITAA